MTIFQLLSCVFGLFMLYVISIHGKKRTLSAVEVSGWSGVWGVFVVLSLFPQLLQGIAGVLHFARVFDLLIVMAFMVLSLLLFFAYFKLKRLSQEIETVVREVAVHRVGSSTKKNKTS